MPARGPRQICMCRLGMMRSHLRTCPRKRCCGSHNASYTRRDPPRGCFFETWGNCPHTCNASRRTRALSSRVAGSSACTAAGPPQLARLNCLCRLNIHRPNERLAAVVAQIHALFTHRALAWPPHSNDQRGVSSGMPSEHAGVIAVYRQSRHFSSTKSSPPAMRRRRMGQPVWSCACVMA